MAVAGAVALHELVQVGPLQRLRLLREVHVRAQVVDPQRLGPGLLLGGLGVEEQDVGLHALGVEDAGRQPQQRVHVALLQQVAPHRLAGPALEQHVVGHDDGAAAVDLEQRLDVLEEVQLLVLGRGPEVLPLVGLVFLLQVARLVDDGDAAFLAERRIGQHHAESLAGIAGQAVHARRDRAGIGVDAVQVQVHDAQPGRVRDQFPALHEPRPQVLLLILVEVLALVLAQRNRRRPAGSRRCRRRVADVSSAVGCTQSTIALMSSRGVKY